MAKTIKFNLILDDYPVRNLEGLQEHFSIEDMLKYYDNGLLLRWLKVRGYEKQYTDVESIDKTISRKELIKALIKIFEVVEMDEAEIEKSIMILTYLEEEKELNQIYKENTFAKKQIIEDYHSGYDALIIHMEENKENMAILKADAIQLEKEYLGLFELDYFKLYSRLANNAPKAIFAILTRDVFRKFWIGEEADEGIYNHIKSSMLTKTKVKEILGENLKIVKRNTQAMWDPIERPETKLMVIQIQPGTFIKNAGEFSEKLSYDDVNDKLLRFNGLEYQCNNENHELLYMEV